MHSREKSSETMWHQVGAFEAHEAKQILEALEAAGIPFELERDDSALLRPLRTVELALAMNPEGAKLAIFVPTEKANVVQALIGKLFTV